MKRIIAAVAIVLCSFGAAAPAFAEGDADVETPRNDRLCIKLRYYDRTILELPCIEWPA
jgi:hypothetical protein